MLLHKMVFHCALMVDLLLQKFHAFKIQEAMHNVITVPGLDGNFTMGANCKTNMPCETQDKTWE